MVVIEVVVTISVQSAFSESFQPRSPEPPECIVMFLFSVSLLDPLSTTALVSVGAEGEAEPHAASLLSSAGLTRCDKPSEPDRSTFMCAHKTKGILAGIDR